MSKFKVGDIVVSLHDRPFSARILKGEEAVVVYIDIDGNIQFKLKNCLKYFEGVVWLGREEHFKLKVVQLENK